MLPHVFMEWGSRPYGERGRFVVFVMYLLRLFCTCFHSTLIPEQMLVCGGVVFGSPKSRESIVADKACGSDVCWDHFLLNRVRRSWPAPALKVKGYSPNEGIVRFQSWRSKPCQASVAIKRGLFSQLLYIGLGFAFLLDANRCTPTYSSECPSSAQVATLHFGWVWFGCGPVLTATKMLLVV